MGCKISGIFTPIGQALAPCQTVGCCAVNELVSRALFIGQLYSTLNFRFCQYRFAEKRIFVWGTVDTFAAKCYSTLERTKIFPRGEFR